MIMVLKKMRVPQLLDDWETKNNVFILNVPMSDQRLKRLQKQAKQVAGFNDAENKKSTFFMDNIVNPNLPPITASSMERKIVKMLSSGLTIKAIAKEIGMTLSRIKKFKVNNKIIQHRCVFFDNDGWMKFRTGEVSNMYKLLVNDGIVSECLTTFMQRAETNNGIVYKNGKKVGKLVTMKMVRRII